MTQFFKTILFSFILLFQCTATGVENNISSMILAEDIEHNDDDNHEDKHHVEPENEELSELEKEALAAEEAELRESGIYEEPIEE